MQNILTTLKRFPRRFIVKRLGKYRFPTFLSLPLTAQCNLRCKFCEINGVDEHIKRSGGRYYSNHLSIEHIKKFAPLIKHANVINMGGVTSFGEPLMSPVFKDTLLYIRRINPRVRFEITTNGIRLNAPTARVIIDCQPASVTFSFHATKALTYETLMGKNFLKARQNLIRFCEMAQNTDKVTSSINFGIGVHNAEDALELPMLAKKWGVDTIHVYPYYKSPNAFVDDVSFYSNADTGNTLIKKVYENAHELGQNISPPIPLLIQGDDVLHGEGQWDYRSGKCPAACHNFVMKTIPTMNTSIAVSYCTRFMPFIFNYDKDIDMRDFKWVWNHPLANALRSLHGSDHPPICKFCRDSRSSVLRSVDNVRYALKRDKAIEATLLMYQENSISPSGSIRLTTQNISSLC